MKPTTNSDTKSAATHDQAPVESFFGYFNHERPHLNNITDAELLGTEPALDGSTTTAGPPPTTTRTQHDLAHFPAKLRERARHT